MVPRFTVVNSPGPQMTLRYPSRAMASTTATDNPTAPPRITHARKRPVPPGSSVRVIPAKTPPIRPPRIALPRSRLGMISEKAKPSVPPTTIQATTLNSFPPDAPRPEAITVSRACPTKPAKMPEQRLRRMIFPKSRGSQESEPNILDCVTEMAKAVPSAKNPNVRPTEATPSRKPPVLVFFGSAGAFW